jgi:predicted component of type VI protein secretion system
MMLDMRCECCLSEDDGGEKEMKLRFEIDGRLRAPHAAKTEELGTSIDCRS